MSGHPPERNQCSTAASSAGYPFRDRVPFAMSSASIVGGIVYLPVSVMLFYISSPRPLQTTDSNGLFLNPIKFEMALRS